MVIVNNSHAMVSVVYRTFGLQRLLSYPCGWGLDFSWISAFCSFLQVEPPGTSKAFRALRVFRVLVALEGLWNCPGASGVRGFRRFRAFKPAEPWLLNLPMSENRTRPPLTLCLGFPEVTTVLPPSVLTMSNSWGLGLNRIPVPITVT